MTASRSTGRQGSTPLCLVTLFGLITLVGQSALAGPDLVFEIPWEQGSVTFTPAGTERPAQGPTAVALGPDGRIWILDTLAHRVQGFDDAGRLVSSVPTPTQHQDLVAVGLDGGIVLWAAHLRRLTWLDPSGVVVATRTLPLHLSSVRSLGFGVDGTLELEDLHGQRYRPGPPGTPRPLREILLDRRQGPPGSSQNCGLHKREGRFLLHRWTDPVGLTDGRESQLPPKELDLGYVTSARPVSPCTPAGMLVETEALAPGSRLAVTRRVVRIVDAKPGEAWTMPGRWPYVPAGRFAARDGVVVLIHPQASGLQVWRWRQP